MTNKTFTSIHVECTPGYDGGLQQSFVIEVFPVGAVELGLEIGGADGGASLVSLEVEIDVLKPCTYRVRIFAFAIHFLLRLAILWRRHPRPPGWPRTWWG